MAAHGSTWWPLSHSRRIASNVCACLRGSRTQVQEEEEEEEGAGSVRAELHAAARAGDVCACERLLSVGVCADVAVEVDATDVDGHTALHWAADAGHAGVAALLLERSANPSAAA